MATNSVRRPSLIILVNGSELPGVIEAEILSNNFLAADRFVVRAALSATGAAIWAANTLQVEIRIGLDDAVTSFLIGNVDRLEIDPIRTEIRLEGRDFTALFIAARTEESFENRTSSEIVEVLAARQGLIPIVAATDTPVGRYYQSQHSRTTLSQFSRATTQWDLMTWLAEIENYDVWVAGRTLNFAPRATVAAILAVTPRDCLTLRLERAMTLAGDLSVTIQSWNSLANQVVTQTAQTAQTASSGAGSGAATYTLVRPNLTADVALALAQDTLAGITQHARDVTLDMPGDLVTAPRMTLFLDGTGTDFDQSYRICEVSRRISTRHGFVQNVRGRAMPWMPFST